jgi:hypothetical protein
MSDTLGQELIDGRLQRLFAYWNAKRGDRPFPTRAEVDPVDFPYILGYVTLVDVEFSPRRYFFRLDGSILVELSGMNYTGKYLDQLPMEEYSDFIKQTYDAVVDTGAPYRYLKEGLFDRQVFSEETLILPLGDHKKPVDMLLVAVIPGDLPKSPDVKVVI